MQTKGTKYFRTFPCQAHQLAEELSTLLNPAIPRDKYLQDSILSKYCGVGTAPADVRVTRAHAKLLVSEERNVRTNRRLLNLSHRFGGMLNGISAEQVFHTARTLIAEVLGEFTYGIYEYSAFTSGAGVGFPRRAADVWYKYRGKITCTPNAVRRVIALVLNTPPWHAYLCEKYGPKPASWLKIVPGNVVFTVPKDSEIDRAAAKEATGNVLLQTAVGYHIRKCLRKVGIDLNDQSRNRKAAWLASMTLDSATLDLSDASNSMTLALCWQLLPDEWYRACIAARSPVGSIGPSSHRWEMMSSMGNGFTFELESLIFWALAESVRRLSGCPGRTLVYGDDIITPTPVAHGVVAVLGFAGFRINAAKSFISGDFRESCGGHYLRGLDITPFYIRKPITDTSRMIWFLNSLRKWAGDTGICDPRFEDLYFRLRRKFVSPTLWCGVRLGSISSLAGPGSPRQRLKFITNGKSIDGIAAVLRTFQARIRSLEAPLVNRQIDDPQIAYEMFGTVPMSTDMSRILVVSGSVGIQANKERDDEQIPLWLREI